MLKNLFFQIKNDFLIFLTGKFDENKKNQKNYTYVKHISYFSIETPNHWSLTLNLKLDK